jgi:branched-chain amino acid transport system substrate-binding protein
VVAAKGEVARNADLIKAMEKADFASVRGPFRYGSNHFPIQNFYLQDVVKEADGTLVLKTEATIVKDDQDIFHDKCMMK